MQKVTLEKPHRNVKLGVVYQHRGSSFLDSVRLNATRCALSLTFFNLDHFFRQLVKMTYPLINIKLLPYVQVNWCSPAQSQWVLQR